jgi:hypothetical protein
MIDRLIPQPDGAFLASVPGAARLFKITPDSVLLPPLQIRSDDDEIHLFPDEAEYIQSDGLYALIRHQPTLHVPWNGAKLVRIDTDTMTVTGSQLLVTASERVVPAPPDVHIDFALGQGGVSWGWDPRNVDQISSGLSGGWEVQSNGSETFVSPVAFVDVEVAESVNPHPRPHISQKSDNQVRTQMLRVTITARADVDVADARLNIVRTRLIEIRDKLEAEAAGPNPSCSTWLQNPNPAMSTTWSNTLAAVIDGGRYARGLYEWERIERGSPKRRKAYDIGANVQGRNPGESSLIFPAGIMLAVNDVSAFYQTTAEGQPYKSESDGPGFYGGNNPRAQAAILLHELAHLVVGEDFMPPEKRDVSFRNDLEPAGPSQPGQDFNRLLLELKCGQLIRTFPH